MARIPLPKQGVGPQFQALAELREKHGFNPATQTTRTWSKGALTGEEKSGNSVKLFCQELGLIPPPEGTWPRNIHILNYLVKKLEPVGFGWFERTAEAANETNKKRKKLSNRTGDREGRVIGYANWPTIGGIQPTMADLLITPVELLDQYQGREETANLLAQNGKPANLQLQLEKMNATGIGYKGLSGVSWLPGTETFKLPKTLEQQLVQIGSAVFLFCDVINDLYSLQDSSLVQLLTHKTPSRIPTLAARGSVDLIRPDIMISSNRDGSYKLVITELESCPAGHGMAHAMQAGYNLPTLMLDRFVEFLAGRDYVVFATAEWSEYVFDQAVFCKALQNRGVNARIIFDAPLEQIWIQAAAWTRPKDLPPHLEWNTNLKQRLQNSGLLELVSGLPAFNAVPGISMPGKDVDREAAEALGIKTGKNQTALFRFGYFDNFSPSTIRPLCGLSLFGVKIFNPMQFFLESKGLMAAIGLTNVREEIMRRDRSGEALRILDTHVATTRMLDPEFTNFEELLRDRALWLTKIAAWDGNNLCWGARGLTFGSQKGDKAWTDHLDEASARPYPMVAQHAINARRFNLAFADYTGIARLMLNARSRLTPFLLRAEGHRAVHAGSTITLRTDTLRVHGASDAVEAPVEFI